MDDDLHGLRCVAQLMCSLYLFAVVHAASKLIFLDEIGNAILQAQLALVLR
jgi:hypothetical protein